MDNSSWWYNRDPGLAIPFFAISEDVYQKFISLESSETFLINWFIVPPFLFSFPGESIEIKSHYNVEYNKKKSKNIRPRNIHPHDSHNGYTISSQFTYDYGRKHSNDLYQLKYPAVTSVVELMLELKGILSECTGIPLQHGIIKMIEEYNYGIYPIPLYIFLFQAHNFSEFVVYFRTHYQEFKNKEDNKFKKTFRFILNSENCPAPKLKNIEELVSMSRLRELGIR